MKSVTARRPRVKPARNISLCVKPDGTAPGVVRIAVGVNSTDYFLYAVASDFGRSFRPEKLGVEPNDQQYHVNLNGTRTSCECLGFLRHGHCKHTAGMAALVAAGRV